MRTKTHSPSGPASGPASGPDSGLAASRAGTPGVYDPDRPYEIQAFIPGADETWHLPAGTTKAQAITTICAVAGQIGASAVEILAFRKIADTTDRAAWSGGPLPPLNWRRQGDLAREMGISERQWRRIEVRLAALGLIARTTAENGYRGYRRGGSYARPLRAGLSLAPALANYPAFVAQLAALEALEEQRMEHILHARTARRRLGLLIATLPDREMKATEALETLTADLCPATPRSAPAEALAAWHAGLLDLEDRIRTALVPLSPTQTSAQTPAQDTDGPRETPCEAPGSRTSCPDADLSPPAASPGTDAAIPESDPTSGAESGPVKIIEKQQKMTAAPDIGVRCQLQPEINSYSLCNDSPVSSKRPPTDVGDRDSFASHPHGCDTCFEQKHGEAGAILNPKVAEKLDHGGLRALASDDIGLYLDALEDWNEALPMILRELGINVSAWLEACEVMGEALAFLCLVILDRNRFHPHAPVLSPGGALRAFTERARRAELDLTRAVLGIWERERQGKQPKAGQKVVQ